MCHGNSVILNSDPPDTHTHRQRERGDNHIFMMCVHVNDSVVLNILRSCSPVQFIYFKKTDIATREMENGRENTGNVDEFYYAASYHIMESDKPVQL